MYFKYGFMKGKVIEMSSDAYKMQHFSATDIGKCIQAARKDKKVSQKELADRLNKSERTIQKYEAGEIDFSVSTIKEIANELDIPWQELLGIETPTISLVDRNDPDRYYKFDTLGDVINALFEITKIKDLSFGISNTKPPEDPSWTSSLTVDGKADAKYNTDLCLFMENWMNKLKLVQSQRMTEENFSDWKKEMIAYYSDTYFSNMSAQIMKEKREREGKKDTSMKKIHIVKVDNEN